jgi:RNA ligase (TIGR02306 family)
MLVPAHEGAEIGDDVAAQLGVTHYEPPEDGGQQGKKNPGANAERPTFMDSKYDLESVYRYADLFIPGEEVECSEKIHGQQARFMYDGNRMWCGSKNECKRPDEIGKQSNWWKMLKVAPWIEEFCTQNPNIFLCGEIFGWVQTTLRYNAQPGQIFFRAFDLKKPDHTFFSKREFRNTFSEDKRVPVVAIRPFDFEALKLLSDGPTLVPGSPSGHIREGIVITPENERIDYKFGRVCLKMVGNTYLEKCKD